MLYSWYYPIILAVFGIVLISCKILGIDNVDVILGSEAQISEEGATQNSQEEQPSEAGAPWAVPAAASEDTCGLQTRHSEVSQDDDSVVKNSKIWPNTKYIWVLKVCQILNTEYFRLLKNDRIVLFIPY